MTELVGKTNTVSTHSRPKAAGADNLDLPRIKHLFQHTAARRRLAGVGRRRACSFFVSTHSRPKAAGQNEGEAFRLILFQHTAARRRLVGQDFAYIGVFGSFNTQPPEGGWQPQRCQSRTDTSFNTQPPEGGWACHLRQNPCSRVSTHSRPKAAGG